MYNDEENKSEDPTEKRLRDAFRKGKTIVSKEIYNLAIIIVASVTVFLFLPLFTSKKLSALKFSVDYLFDDNLYYGSLSIFVKKIFSTFLYFLIPIFILITVAVFLANFIHHNKFNMNFALVKIDFKRLSIISGFKKFTSKDILFEVTKNTLKVFIAFVIGYFVVIHENDRFSNCLLEMNGFFDFSMYLLRKLLFFIIVFMLLITLVDYLYYKRQYFRSLRMTKREKQDELKETEQNPHMKSYVKNKKTRELDRTLKIIKRGTIMICSDDNLVVVLEYIEEKYFAPIVTLKASGHKAIQIKSIGYRYSIPIIKNHNLCHALFNHIKLYEQIAREYFDEVAKILSYTSSK